MKVVIPYRPRFPQDEIHKQLETHRFCVLVAHRRLGKTVLSVNHLIKRAITDRKERGMYAYLAPFRNQAEQIAWGYLKHYTSQIPAISINEQKLSILLPNGATIRIFGADNPDALRGMYFDGVVIDEVAQIKPTLWGEVIRPALADRKGWAAFIGTPKGINLFSQLYDQALNLMSKGDPDWIAMLYSVEQTHVIDEKELAALKVEMSENEYRQEFLCDFSAAQDNGLIPIDDIRAAANKFYRESEYMGAPLIYGIDVARFGSDASVIFKRRGLVAFEPIVIRKFDNMALADRIAVEMAKEKPDAVFIDSGAGQGVIDRLRQMRFDVVEVPFGAQAIDKEQFANRRMEMWWNMAQWIKQGGAIPPDPVLQGDLGAPTYGYTPKGPKILEARIGRSPDLADALALTFAAPVAPKLSRSMERAIYGVNDSYDPQAAFESEYWNS